MTSAAASPHSKPQAEIGSTPFSFTMQLASPTTGHLMLVDEGEEKLNVGYTSKAMPVLDMRSSAVAIRVKPNKAAHVLSRLFSSW